MNSLRKFALCFVVALVLFARPVAAFFDANLSHLHILDSTLDRSIVGGITPAAGTFTTLTGTNLSATHGLTNSAGAQIVRVTSCTTAASLNAACNTTVTWPVSMGEHELCCSVQPSRCKFTGRRYELRRGEQNRYDLCRGHYQRTAQHGGRQRNAGVHRHSRSVLRCVTGPLFVPAFSTVQRGELVTARAR